MCLKHHLPEGYVPTLTNPMFADDYGSFILYSCTLIPISARIIENFYIFGLYGLILILLVWYSVREKF